MDLDDAVTVVAVAEALPGVRVSGSMAAARRAATAWAKVASLVFASGMQTTLTVCRLPVQRMQPAGGRMPDNAADAGHWVFTPAHNLRPDLRGGRVMLG